MTPLRLSLALFLAACAARTVPPAPVVTPAEVAAVVAPAQGAAVAPALQDLDLVLPPALIGDAVVLSPDDPDYARADFSAAVKPEGAGGLVDGLVVKFTSDVPVFRMWSGPEVVDARGNTNRLGQWWSWNHPAGTQADYRRRFEVCTAWNELDWVVGCTLKAGAVVTVGPGQSVSAEVCGKPNESYPANPQDWQIYVARAWARTGPEAELVCPDVSADFEVSPQDVSRPK
jgi:hypothetical protein